MKAMTLLKTAAVCAMLGFAAARAGAEPRGPAGPHLDARYGHNHYYPGRGFVIGARPRGGVMVGGRYWYAGGVWYAPYGPRWVVVGPPIGFFAPVLPPFYTTLWFGGVPYYYANDTYYVYRGPAQGYEVVAPPPTAADNVPPDAAPAAASEFYIYPRSGQDDAQQSKDRYECHRWAADQTGFDPTQPAAAGATQDLRPAYRRAIVACLEGRGYTVK